LPRWSPDGKQIAFQGALPGKSWRIYLISSDGGTPQEVTNGESGADGHFDAAWSADGSSLVYGGLPNAQQQARGRLMIRVLDLKTRRISLLPGSEDLWSPRWSPDGNYIAALSPASELMLYDFRTHTYTKLAAREVNYMAWSRESDFVYFDTTGSDAGFFRVRIRDRKIERIVSLKDVHRSMGTFGPWTGVAPDGSLLLQRDAGASEIYALDWEAP